MRFSKVAGACAIATALTTLPIHLAPPSNLVRAIIVVHVCLVLVSMLGVALARRRVSLPLAILGMAGTFVFTLGELLRMSLAFFAKAGLGAAWAGINDALFHLFLFGFVAGLVCFGALLVRGRGLERATGLVFLVWAAVSAFGWLGGIVPNLAELPTWVSVTLQPLGRGMVGVWLLLLDEVEHPG